MHKYSNHCHKENPLKILVVEHSS